MIGELDTRYLFHLASKIMFESLSVHLEGGFVSLLNLDGAEWKDLFNDEWPRPSRFKFSWKQFESRVEEKHLFARDKLTPENFFIVPLLCALLVDACILISLMSNLL